MARLSRHELKEDEFVSTVEAAEEFARQHASEIVAGVLAALIVIAAVVGWHMYSSRQQGAANAALGLALKTYQADVGPAPATNLFNPDANTPQPGAPEFSTDQQKYQAALKQFTEVVAKYPREEAADFARYHIGLCQAALGNDTAAVSTLQAAGKSNNPNVAALADEALAGELTRTGRADEAVRIYQRLAEHPTSTVPRAAALLAEANVYRSTKPAQARVIYEQVQKEFGSDPYLAQQVQQQMAGLPK
ncbi:MAG TPA: tetratricopeptide repeat protein [Terriglobia bacterium]|nr:tetratricopeptide repeat protein [Terriglobia bacterium]